MSTVHRAGKLAIAPAALAVGCWALVAFGRIVERAEDHRFREEAWGRITA
jgi:hypothetical protein